MAKQPTSSGSSKSKDDDSWGKLASDLLGIQFGGPEDDFDLPDEEAPPAKPIVAETSPVPTASTGLKPPVSQQQSEPDLSFPEDDEDDFAAEAEEAVEPISIEESASDEREKSDPDIWDQLESWNWDEPVKPAPRSHSDSPSGRGGSRSGHRSSGGPPRDRDSGRDRSRGGEEVRPRPQREAAAAPDQSSSERPPRREGTPRREERPRRSESRDEAPRSEQTPRREQRPTRQSESTEQRPPHSTPPRPLASNKPDDDFAAGLDDEPKQRRGPPVSPRRTDSAAAPPVSSPAFTPTSIGDNDDFAMDLFQELARDADEAGTGATGIDAESGGEASSDERPRRRRRRRRGGRGRRPDAVAGQSETEDGPDSEELDDDNLLGFANEDDSSRSDTDDDDDDDSKARTESVDDEEGSERGEQRRPRRRRRRGSRRPSERPAEGAGVTADKQSGSEQDDGEDDDDEVRDEPRDRSERVDEEPLAPVNYEGIPTWEEAISYLIRSRGPEPRGRGNGGSRGRGGSPQRR